MFVFRKQERKLEEGGTENIKKCKAVKVRERRNAKEQVNKQKNMLRSVLHRQRIPQTALHFEKLPVTLIVEICPSVRDVCAFIVTSCDKLSDSTLHYLIETVYTSHIFNNIHL